MRIRGHRYYALFALVGLWLVIAWALFGDPEPQEPSFIDVEQAVLRVKYLRIQQGMELKEVEAIMGPAPPSLSSQIERGYYVWKSKRGWISIMTENGKGVTSKQFRPEMTDLD